jgi:hypothetical protein
VLNLLGRLLEPPLPAPIDAPQALKLQIEPEANLARYDHLRSEHAA